MRDYGRYMFGVDHLGRIASEAEAEQISPGGLVCFVTRSWQTRQASRKMWDALINAEGWEDDPVLALGELVPAAVLCCAHRWWWKCGSGCCGYEVTYLSLVKSM